MPAANLDAVNGLLGDVRPRPGRVHELRVLDLVLDVHILVERELAGQGDVDDDAQGPHVQGPVEALLLEDVRVEHLGRQVGGRAHDALAERLLADDARVAKVAQLHLFFRAVVVGNLVRWIDSCRLMPYTWLVNLR